MKINTSISFNLFLNKEKGEEVIFYPYMTTRFSTSYIMEMDRNDFAQIELKLCAKASKKYDGWGTGDYISTNGVDRDNKCTFVFKGMAFHCHDHEVWVYPETAMEIGRF